MTSNSYHVLYLWSFGRYALITVTDAALMREILSLPILGTLTVEQIYQDRDRFAQLVREVASPDVGRMGIEVLSFTIKVSSGK